jgi:hypothetical protein
MNLRDPKKGGGFVDPLSDCQLLKKVSCSVKLIRGGAFVLTTLAVFARLTLRETKNNKVLSYFRGTPNTGIQQSRSDKMHRYPDPAS